MTSIDFSYDCFITLPPFTLMSFKTKDVILKYVLFLKIGTLALDQERAIFIVLKFEYVQYICDRPDQLKPISRSISSEWYAVFMSQNFTV